MKKLVVLLIGLLVSLGLIFALNPKAQIVPSEGYLVPDSAKIASKISQSTSDPVSLQHIAAEGMIYSSMLYDYEYESKTAVDMSYPMYTNGGATVQFLSEDFWLVGTDFELLETYKGLYLTDGNTYNEDLTLADGEEFLLISVGNGLYLNAQNAVFTTVLGEIEIPANSIIEFTESSVNFYSFNAGKLEFTNIEEMFDASIAIGEHSYTYTRFLDALGLLQKAIDKAEKDESVEDLQEEILSALGDNNQNSEDDSDADVGEEDKQVQGEDAAGNTDGNSSQEGDKGNLGTLMGGTSSESVEGGSDKPGSTSGSGQNGDGAADDLMDGDGDESTDGTKPEAGAPDAGDTEGGDVSSSGDADKEDEDKDSEDDDDDDEELPEGENEEGEGGTGTESGEDLPFVMPVVHIDNLDSWAYALKGSLTLEDPSAVVRKGVLVAVYGKITGVGAGVENEEGIKVYSAEEYKGGSTQLRKTYYSSQQFTLDGIPPDTTFYVQYSYRYTQEVEDETGEMVYKSFSVLSDFYEISTTKIEDSNIQTVAISYDPEFAAAADSFTFNNFYIQNTSAYDETLDTFDNFKLNTLPYFTKLTIDFKDEADKDVVITSSALAKATEEGGIDYAAGNGLLASNSKHEYTLTATDRYGNVLPLIVNGKDYTDYVGVVYTAKQCPTITIEEVSNVMDYLTMKVTVSDPDHALKNGAVLKLYTKDTLGNYSNVSGDWADKSRLESSYAQDGITPYIALEDAKDGAEYQFSLDSLAFARTYVFSVYGDYASQPDNVVDYTIADTKDALLGTAKAYTAAMTTGSVTVDVNADVRRITDTGAVLDFLITDESSVELLALVDEFRITFTDTKADKDRVHIAMAEKDFIDKKIGDLDENGNPYTYNAELGFVTIYEKDNIRLDLVGTEEALRAGNFWELLLATQSVKPDDGTIETADAPAELRVTVADGTFESATKHDISFDAVVIKSGVEYELSMNLGQLNFDTKKETPKVIQDDVFLINDFAQFTGFDFIDKDGAIIGDGKVEVQLFSGETMLQKKTVNVNDDPQNVEFTGLTKGLTYGIRVVAKNYNDQLSNSGYQSDFALHSFEIVAGSDIMANITLNSLEYVYQNDGNQVLSVSGGEVTNGIQASIDATGTGSLPDGLASENPNWAMRKGNPEDLYSPYYSLEDDFDLEINKVQNGTAVKAKANVLVLEYSPDLANLTAYGDYAIFFLDASKKVVLTKTMSYTLGVPFAVTIPDNAVYVSFLLSGQEYLKENGFTVSGYAVDESDVVVSAKTCSKADGENTVISDGHGGEILPYTLANSPTTGAFNYNSGYYSVKNLSVQPGDRYFADGSSMYEYVYLHNSQGVCVGYERWSLQKNRVFTVPEGIYSISFSLHTSYTMTLYQLDGLESGAQYKLDSDVDVFDKDGVLLDKDGKSTAYLVVEKSENMNGNDYSEIAVPDSEKGRWIALSNDAPHTGSLSYIDMLDPNSKYRLSVKATYKATDAYTEITLATQEITTDGALIMINNATDMHKIKMYPYANFLVTADIVLTSNYDIAFYGTIDFDGHTLTTTSTTENRFIETIGKTGVIKNLVYEVNNGRLDPIINSNYGLIENVMIRTNGTVKTPTGRESLLLGGNLGTVRNFIIELNGDAIFTSYYSAIGIQYNYGVVENGYIYTTNGGALVAKGYSDAYHIGGVVQRIESSGVMRNVYSVYDVHIEPDEDDVVEGSVFAISSQNGRTGISNCYHVGDYYRVSSTSNEKTKLPTRRVVQQDYTTTVDDVWYISTETYQPYNTNDHVQEATQALMRDVSWQEQVLTEGFLVQQSVEMGYYPRLIFPTCMEQHQPYRVLPTSEMADKPMIVADRCVEASDNSATITLRFENKTKSTITGIAIGNLLTTIGSQGLAEDGLWDVTLTVASPTEYWSAYTVDSITYNNGGLNATLASGYETSSFAFYKPVASLQDWYDINLHMDWNYRLTKDLAFDETSSLAGMMLNGSRDSTTASTTFKGILDGDGHSVSGFTLKNTDRTYIIYALATGAQLRNLYINDVVFEGYNTPAAHYYTGFVRYAVEKTVIDNVHMNHVDIASSGWIGALVGYSRAYMTNCSVSDVSIDLKSNKYSVGIGGLVGYTYRSAIYNSYARDVAITAYNVSAVSGIGGILGYSQETGIYNCYAQGAINTDAKNIGGIVGATNNATSSAVYNNIADVNIDTTAGSTGGLIGRTGGIRSDNLVLGDVFASTTDVHRVIGLKDSIDYNTRPNYAYAGQSVNTLTAEDYDDAMYLFDATELRTVKSWVDTMHFNTQWDVSKAASGYTPTLYYKDTETPLPWGEDIALPGGETFTASVEDARYIETGDFAGSYYVDVRIADKNKTTEELMAAIKDKSMQVEIEGMLMEDMALWADDGTNDDTFAASTLADKWYYTLKADGDSGAVQMQIYTTTFTRAFDTYKMVVRYGTSKVNMMIDYGKQSYFEVKNITDWEMYMKDGHGTTSENFKITGLVDFKEGTRDVSTPYTGLMLGNLVGVGDTAGFANLYFETTKEQGGNWITSCKTVDGLSFSHFDARFEELPTQQTAGSFIGYLAGDLQNVKLEDLYIKSNNANGKVTALGFVYELTGMVHDVTVHDIDFDFSQSGTITYTRNYTGSIVSYLYGSIYNATADGIDIDAKYMNYIGGLVGYMDGRASDGNLQRNENITVTNAIINGASAIGAVWGSMTDALTVENISVEDVQITASGDVQITASGTAGGMSGGTSFWSGAREKYSRHITVRNSTVTSVMSPTNTNLDYRTGGVTGYDGHYTFWEDVIVENVIVHGYGRVGGFAGHGFATVVVDMQVIGCDVVQHSAHSTEETCGGAGGVYGTVDLKQSSYRTNNVTVRDTNIVADYNAGGVVGQSYRTLSDSSKIIYLLNVYVAEDVTVTATIDNAGGLVGQTSGFYFNEIAVGASVTAMGKNAGGLIGYVPTTTSSVQHAIGVYTCGSVIGANNVGGAYGYVAEDVFMTSEKQKGIIVTADLTSGGAVDPFANMERTLNYESAVVGIWDNLLVNGQPAQNLYCEQQAVLAGDPEVNSKTPLRYGVHFLTASAEPEENDFLLQSTYKEHAFADFDSTYLITDDMLTAATVDGAVDSDSIQNADGTVTITDITANKYMPFITNGDNSGTILSNTNEHRIVTTVDDNRFGATYDRTYQRLGERGITRPVNGERAGATVVYPSGIDTINIETTQPSVTVRFADGTAPTHVVADADTRITSAEVDGVTTYTYTFDVFADSYGGQYNAITLGYDYQTAIVVDGITYESSDLARTVMTTEERWYYIGATGGLKTGTDNSIEPQDVEIPDITNVGEKVPFENVVHLWQGLARTADGTVYSHDTSNIWKPYQVDGAVDETTGETTRSDYICVTAGEIQAKAQPVFKNLLWNIYYNFSVDADGNYADYRALSLGGVTYAVFTAQGMSNDGYILAMKDNATYFVMLSKESDSLVSYKTSVSGVDYTGVAELSNSFGYTGSNAVLRYQDGKVVVWNYSTGAVKVTDKEAVETPADVLLSTSGDGIDDGEDGTNDTNGSANVAGNNLLQGVSRVFSNFTNYASNYASGIFNPDVPTEPDLDVPTDNSYNTSEELLEGYLSEQDEEASENDATQEPEEESDANAGDSTANGESGAPAEGDGNAEGKDSANLEGSGTGIDGATAEGASGADVADGDGAVVSGDANASGDADVTAGESADGSSTEGTTSGASASEAGDSGSSGDSGTADTSGTSDANGAGEAGMTSGASDNASADANGGASGTGDASAPEEDATSGSSEGDNADETGSTEQAGAQQEPAYTVAYNPYTSSYEVYALEDIAMGTGTAQSMNPVIHNTLQSTQEEDVSAPEKDFTVNIFAFNVLSSDEKHGFAFLGLLVFAGITVLTVLHIKYKKR